MRIILEATYRDGGLVPDRNLGIEKEGKCFKIIVLEEKESGTRRDHFFQFVRDHSFGLPDDFRFSRDEMYE